MEVEKRLYSEEIKETITYTYKINNYGGGSVPSVCDLGKVTIEFVNGKFSKCLFPFSATYTQHQWEVLEAISLKIREISKEK